MLALAQKYNVLVITDDVYFPFSYESNDNKGDVLVAYDKRSVRNVRKTMACFESVTITFLSSALVKFIVKNA